LAAELVAQVVEAVAEETVQVAFHLDLFLLTEPMVVQVVQRQLRFLQQLSLLPVEALVVTVAHAIQIV
jgi:hypothetical protein